MEYSIDEIEEINIKDFEALLIDVLNSPKPPEIDFFKGVLRAVLKVYDNEDEKIRPKDKNGVSGGLLDFTDFDDVVIIPDLHARRGFIRSLISWDIYGDGQIVIELLNQKKLTILCLGDGVHGEANFAERWIRAYEEYRKGLDKMPNMDNEITDSFNLMIAIMLLKIRFSYNFHFLKGNHENIYNETGGGNYAFAKYSNEGAMVLSYFRKRYDEEVLNMYSKFEKSLPLFVVGRVFLASHSEPAYFFDYDTIVDYKDNAELIESLTWTDNYSSEPDSVEKLISYFIPQNSFNTFYFGGHRPIKSLYYRINNDRYVQIHNPRKQIVCKINQQKGINLDEDIIELPKKQI